MITVAKFIKRLKSIKSPDKKIVISCIDSEGNDYYPVIGIKDSDNLRYIPDNAWDGTIKLLSQEEINGSCELCYPCIAVDTVRIDGEGETVPVTVKKFIEILENVANPDLKYVILHKNWLFPEDFSPLDEVNDRGHRYDPYGSWHGDLGCVHTGYKQKCIVLYPVN